MAFSRSSPRFFPSASQPDMLNPKALDNTPFDAVVITARTTSQIQDAQGLGPFPRKALTKMGAPALLAFLEWAVAPLFASSVQDRWLSSWIPAGVTDRTHAGRHLEAAGDQGPTSEQEGSWPVFLRPALHTWDDYGVT